MAFNLGLQKQQTLDARKRQAQPEAQNWFNRQAASGLNPYNYDTGKFANEAAGAPSRTASPYAAAHGRAGNPYGYQQAQQQPQQQFGQQYGQQQYGQQPFDLAGMLGGMGQQQQSPFANQDFMQQLMSQFQRNTPQSPGFTNQAAQPPQQFSGPPLSQPGGGQWGPPQQSGYQQPGLPTGLDGAMGATQMQGGQQQQPPIGIPGVTAPNDEATKQAYAEKARQNNIRRNGLKSSMSQIQPDLNKGMVGKPGTATHGAYQRAWHDYANQHTDPNVRPDRAAPKGYEWGFQNDLGPAVGMQSPQMLPTGKWGLRNARKGKGGQQIQGGGSVADGGFMGGGIRGNSKFADLLAGQPIQNLPIRTMIPQGPFAGNTSHQQILNNFQPQMQRSDRRLKSNIKRIGTHPLGVGIYEYDLENRRETGVMAQELLPVLPDAVSMGDDGYYRVNYEMIQ